MCHGSDVGDVSFVVVVVVVRLLLLPLPPTEAEADVFRSAAMCSSECSELSGPKVLLLSFFVESPKMNFDLSDTSMVSPMRR
mmetsp:Transcript_33175/g.73199  ORF Transcript_33175/g.73199 Transcript_33175/m.73199 type:complete len:82 (+) Transcript_33175:1802-2047(+)